MDNIEKTTEQFRKGYQTIFYSSAPLAAALGMGLVYAFLIHEAIPTPIGWAIGGISAAGLEFAGMQTISIAVKEKSVWWISFSALYAATHVGALLTIEFFDIGGETVVGSALIVTSILAYIAQGYEAQEKASEAREKRDVKDRRTHHLQGQKDAIDMEAYKEIKAEEVRNERLSNRRNRISSANKQRTNSEQKRTKANKSEQFVPFVELSSEQKSSLLNQSWAEYQSNYAPLHGEIKKTRYYKLKGEHHGNNGKD